MAAFAQIGSFQFITKRGEDPVAPAMVLEDITRPNIDSQAYRQKGKRAPVVTWITEADCSNPTTIFANYQAIQGTLQNVILDDQQTLQNVVVLYVRRVRVKKVLNAVGGLVAGGYILTAQWTLQGT